MKEFWIYTGLRVALFAAAFLVVFGVWFAFGTVNPAWAAVIAFAVSAPASYVLLNRPRNAFAHRVAGRADRMIDRYEAAKSKEDLD